MHIIIIILSILAGIIAIVLFTAAFTKKSYFIQREISINAPLEKAFNYVKFLRNWDNFNERAVADPGKKNEFRGTDGTAGFIYAWSGNKKVGEGEKEIKLISEGKKIETEIRFVKPFTAVGHTNITTESIAANQTKVTMSNASKLKYPLNFLLLFVKKGIAGDMDKSLSVLKDILEKQVQR